MSPLQVPWLALAPSKNYLESTYGNGGGIIAMMSSWSASILAAHKPTDTLTAIVRALFSFFRRV